MASFVNLMDLSKLPFAFFNQRFYTYPVLGSTGVQIYFLERLKLKFQ